MTSVPLDKPELCLSSDGWSRNNPPAMRIIGIIPARYASTRFPGKPLHLIAGQPLVQHVVERCRLAQSLSEVVVATDDARIAVVARKFCRVEMTSEKHPSGTDRIAEVVERCECDAAVNIQGDEPLIDPAVIDAVARALDDAPMSTASGGRPHRSEIALRAASTRGRRTISASTPTSATRRLPSSKTATRTLQGS